MPAERRPGELQYEPDKTDENFLEQLVDSVNRIHVGLDATYAAVVRMDEHMGARAIARIKEPTVSAAFVETYLANVLAHAAEKNTAQLLAQIEGLRSWVLANGLVQS